MFLPSLVDPKAIMDMLSSLGGEKSKAASISIGFPQCSQLKGSPVLLGLLIEFPLCLVSKTHPGFAPDLD